MTTLQQGLAIDDVAQQLYEFLPGKPHPYGNQALSFPGVAAELGLAGYWQGGSKQPAIRALLEGVLNSGTGRFSALVTKIVERSVTYRKRNNPLTRDEIERLNEALLRLGFKIPELHGEGFLGCLPRQGKPQAPLEAAPSTQSLAQLNTRLLTLATIKTQELGYAFERFLTDLFALHGLVPRGSFRNTGEQIDGSFQIRGETFLLEAKWQDALTNQADLLTFSGKVGGKAEWSRGLFVSYAGFSDDGLTAFAQGRRTNIICMNGLDLTHVLSGQLNLVDVIDHKLRRAVETGRAFVPVRDLFISVT